MRKILVLFTVLLLAGMLTGCGSDVLAEMDGKSTKVEKGSGEGKKVVTFAYYMDEQGKKAVADVIDNEIKNAEENNNAEKAKALKEIKSAFDKEPLKIIKNVSVAGPFNGWKPRKATLKKGECQGNAAYYIKKEWEFATEQAPYKFVFGLNVSDDATAMQDVWVPDPRAENKQDDGFGGFNTILDVTKAE